MAPRRPRDRARSPLRPALLCGLASALSAHGCKGPGPTFDAAEGLAIKDPREVPAASGRSSPETVRVSLVAREIVAEIAPDTTFPVWAFNGTVPGPLIRVVEGDTVEITLTNEIDSAEPHSLDLHAAIGPGGGAAVSEVHPGETRTFSFRASRRGAFIYHCAAEGMPWEHLAHGMFGLIQVDPPGGLTPGYRELYVGQSEWYLGDPEGDGDEHGGDSMGKHRPRPRYGLSTEKASDERPDLVTFNGHARALSDPGLFGGAMTAAQGEKVRVFFVNGGPNKISSLHMVGQIFDRAYTGHPADGVRNEETLLVAPGSAAVVELEASVPGTYTLVDHALFRVPKGAAALFHVEPARPPGAGDEAGSWPLDLFRPPSYSSTGH